VSLYDDIRKAASDQSDVVAMLMVDDPRGVTVQVARRVLGILNDYLEPRDQTWPDPTNDEAAVPA
jgi:hypothetical protein